MRLIAVPSLALLLAALAAPATAAIECNGNCQTASPNLLVGSSGAGWGSLAVNGGSSLGFGGLGGVGAFGLSNPAGETRGLLTIDGVGSHVAIGGVSNSQFWSGGDGGHGTVVLSNSGTLTIDAFDNPGGFGDARLYVGRNGTGSVSILSGASVIVRDQGRWGADEDIFIGMGGSNYDSRGTLLVSGGQLALSGNAAYLNIGRSSTSAGSLTKGSGDLRIDSGGKILIDGTTSQAGFHIARGDNSDGRVEILGAGSSLEMRGRYTTAWIANDWYALAGARAGTGRAYLHVGQQGLFKMQSDPEPPGQLRTDLHIGFGLGKAEVLVDGGGRLEVANGLRISTDGSTGERKQFGRLTVNDSGVVSAGAFVFIGNGDPSRISGVLAGTGSLISPRIELRDGGLIAPGNSPGTLRLQGDLHVVGGLLELQIAGPGSGEHDLLDIDGSLSFTGGRIELAFIDGYLPKAGESFSLVRAGSVTGLGLAQLSFSGLAPGFEYAIDPSAGLLTVTALNDAQPVPEPESALLLLSGLLGLAALTRRRQTRGSQA